MCCASSSQTTRCRSLFRRKSAATSRIPPLLSISTESRWPSNLLLGCGGRRDRAPHPKSRLLGHRDSVEILRRGGIRDVAADFLRKSERHLVVCDEDAQHIVFDHLLGLLVQG